MKDRYLAFFFVHRGRRDGRELQTVTYDNDMCDKLTERTKTGMGSESSVLRAE